MFSKKDFETYFISPRDLLDFSFEVVFGGAIEGQTVWAGATEDEVVETMAAEGGTAVQGVAAEDLVIVLAIDK